MATSSALLLEDKDEERLGLNYNYLSNAKFFFAFGLAVLSASLSIYRSLLTMFLICRTENSKNSTIDSSLDLVCLIWYCYWQSHVNLVSEDISWENNVVTDSNKNDHMIQIARDCHMLAMKNKVRWPGCPDASKEVNNRCFHWTLPQSTPTVTTLVRKRRGWSFRHCHWKISYFERQHL